MKKQIKVSFFFTLISTISLGIIYPVLLAGVSFVIPSLPQPLLFIQPIQREDVFQGRPSMSGGFYSGASNLSLTSLDLQKQVSERLKHLAKDSPGIPDLLVPHDLLFASASGYDADLSPQAALYQVYRIAKARNMDRGMLQRLVERHIQPKFWGFIGSETVNVIQLNESLEKLAAKLNSPAGAGMFHIERSLPH